MRTLRTLLDVKNELLRMEPQPKQLQNIVSSIHALVGTLPDAGSRSKDDALAAIPLDPKTFLPRLNATVGARLDYTPEAWVNIRSHVKQALRLTGAYSVLSTRQVELDPHWRAAVSLLGGPQKGIRIISAWGSLNTVPPEAIRCKHIAEIENWLTEWVPPGQVRNLLMEAVRDWNQAINEVPAWPGTALDIKTRRDEHYNRPRSTWSDAVHQEIAAIRAAFVTPDLDGLMGTARPLSDSAATGAISLIYRMLGAFSEATNLDPKTINMVGILLTPENAKNVYDFQAQWLRRKKPDMQLSHDVSHMARLIVRLARGYFRRLVSVDDLHRLERMAVVRRPRQGGMTKKNQDLVHLFEDQKLLARFLHLPGLIFDRYLKRADHSATARRKLKMAVAMALDIVAPLRPKNQASLVIGEHLTRTRIAGMEVLLIKVAGDDVKNRRDLTFEISGDVVRLYDQYLEFAYGGKAEGQLFLYRRADARAYSPSALSKTLARFIDRELGISMSAHQFRHVIGYVYLLSKPGDYETVRQLPGHNDIRTTMTFYAAMDMRQASKRVSKFVQLKKNELAPLANARTRRSKSRFEDRVLAARRGEPHK